MKMIALVLAVLGAAATPAAATDVFNPWVAQVKRATPDCREFQEFAYIGRVAGYPGNDSPRSVSFVGCFPTVAQCHRWGDLVSGRMNGRIILARCGLR
ncbi:hypothetical protein [Acuticoccus sp.]|uniref:hypothetical protein n=1 Tax=Acuticoccus sp. TaxID=1904378 RepID=UPI003B515A32